MKIKEEWNFLALCLLLGLIVGLLFGLLLGLVIGNLSLGIILGILNGFTFSYFGYAQYKRSKYHHTDKK